MGTSLNVNKKYIIKNSVVTLIIIKMKKLMK